MGEQGGADIEAVEDRGVAGRVHAVGEEYEDYIFFWIDPEYGAGESEVPECFRRGFVAGRGVVGIVGIGFVESEAAPAGGAFVGCE